MLLQVVILLVVLVSCCYGQTATLSAPVQSLSPGQSAAVSLSLASAAQSIAAIQFDLQSYPSLALQATAGDQLRPASKILYFASIGPRALRCLIVGMNQTAIADGELLKVFLSVDPAASQGVVQVSIANVIASDPNGFSVRVAASAIGVQIQTGAFAKVLPANAVLNAATLSPGPLSPGEIITIFRWNSLPIGSLTIAGMPAPVLYSGVTQINAVVPFALDPTQPATLEVQDHNGAASASLPAAAVRPGIFTTNGSGLGPAAVLNEDYTVNSFANPARPGSVIMIYGTGFGTLQAPVTDGQAATAIDPASAVVTANLAGMPAEVLYAGSAPGLIAGVTQINIRLPGGISHNSSASLTLNVLGSSTPSGTTVAIQ
jgi:uncharacterized protein (TIGR03437 family)